MDQNLLLLCYQFEVLQYSSEVTKFIFNYKMLHHITIQFMFNLEQNLAL